MADTKTETPASELRRAATLLAERVADFRREAKSSYYWRGFAEYGHGVDNAMGGAGGRLAMLFTPEAAEALASWLETATRIARAHAQASDYEGLPEFRYCLECRDEETDCVQVIDGALAVARALNGGSDVA